MINIEVAEKVMAQIAIGQNVALFLDDARIIRKVLEKTAYGLTIEGLKNHIYVPVEFTELYRMEIEQMRMPNATDGTTAPRRPGRPAKGAQANGPQAPAELHQATAQPATAPGWPPQPVTPQQPAMEQVQDAHGWAMTAVGDALERLKEDISTLLQSVIADVGTDEAPPVPTGDVVPLGTCAACDNCNFAENKCNLFGVTPPMKVVSNAKKLCDKYDDSNYVPF